MTLAQTLLHNINKIYEVAGVVATYDAKDESPRSVCVIVNYDLSQYGDALEVSKTTATISVRVSEVEHPPRQGDTFAVDNREFRVDTALQSDELEHTVLVS